MTTIKLPEEITYAELYFTLRCNFRCLYCINSYEQVQRFRPEKSAEELAKDINRIDFGHTTLTIGGGEPTLRPDFYEFVKLLKPEIHIDLLSNLQFNIDRFIRQMDPKRFTHGKGSEYKSIRISYHPTQSDPFTLVAKARLLQNMGFSIGIFGIAHPENISANIEMAEIARKNKVYFFVKEFLGEYNKKMFGFYKYEDALSGNQKVVQCRTSELLIDSNGDIYKCHKDLYDMSRSVGNIGLVSDIPFMFRECNFYGNCNPCDIKSKVDSTLKKSRCSVEIKEI